MTRSPFSLAVLPLALCATASAQTQFILMPDSTSDKIVKFDAFDGTMLDADFIVDAANVLTYDFGTPKDVFQVDDEIWVLDQVADSIFRFDLDGNWVGTTNGAAGTLDNCRGGEYVNGVVYVTNDGTNNGATVDTVVMFDTAGVKTGQFSASDSGSSPFDVVGYNGELLVMHFTSTNKMGRYDYAGTPLTPEFHSSNGSTGIDSPEQGWVTAAGNLLVAGFATPIGIYEYDNTGAQINFYSNSVFLRGLCELGNGNILFSDSQGAKIFDRTLLTTSTAYTSTGCQFFGLLDTPPATTTYCTAGVSTNGCVPAISGTGTPSVSASSGFVLDVANVEGQKQGLFFYGITGQASSTWGLGGTSFLCVKAPTQRMGIQTSGGTAGLCDGALSEDWLAFIAAHPFALGAPFSSGNVVNAQAWYRDPPAVKTTNLSNGVEFTLVP